MIREAFGLVVIIETITKIMGLPNVNYGMRVSALGTLVAVCYGVHAAGSTEATIKTINFEFVSLTGFALERDGCHDAPSVVDGTK